MGFANSAPPPNYFGPGETPTQIAPGIYYGQKADGSVDNSKGWGNTSSPGGKKNAPTPPDYTGAAKQEAGASQQAVNQQTQQNRPDQTNAFGSTSQWTIGPDGKPHQSVGFGGPLAGISSALQGQFANSIAKPFDNGSAARDQAIQAGYSQATSRLDPQWNQRQEQMGAQLANQGLDPNSAAYRNAMQQFGQQRNDAYGSAMNSAISNGNQAQALTFNQNLAARQMPLEQLQGLQGFLNMPNFMGAGQAQTPQLLPAAMAQGNAAYQNWAQGNANNADSINAGLGILSAPLGFLP